MKDIRITDRIIGKGEKYQGFITVPGTDFQTPVTVVNGVNDGKVLLCCTGVHGGEYPGVAAVSSVSKNLNPEDINGAVIFLNCLNYKGMTEMEDALVPDDMKNINRAFPGSPDGSVTERIQYWVATEVISQVDFVIDLHSGGAYETLTDLIFFPSAFGEGMRSLTLDVASHLDFPYLVSSYSVNGLYSYACSVGIPALLLERSGHGELDKEKIEAYIKDIHNVLVYMGIMRGDYYPAKGSQKIFEKTIYLETDMSGFWYPDIEIEKDVKKGERLGVMKDIFGNVLKEYYAEMDGKVLYYNAALIAKEGFTNLVAYGQNI